MIKVLLADDQPLVRTGFRMILDVITTLVNRAVLGLLGSALGPMSVMMLQGPQVRGSPEASPHCSYPATSDCS